MQRRDLPPELPSGRLDASEPSWGNGPASGPAAPVRRPRFDPEAEVLSVGDLDRRIKRLLEGSTGDVRVEGEVCGLKVPASGHAYFTLKDEREEAAIECVMYRTAAPRALRLLAEGARVVLAGKASLYVPRGRLQFIAEHAAPAGRGALLEALERLKEKLAADGLFSPDRKRALPRDPRVVGVVTSNSGAAIHDIITVAFRRGGVRLILAPAPVQGAGAAQKIAQAIDRLEQVPEVEVIIVGRGGGSADDLSAFNDEVVVRKVAAARVPVVSAVGHEVDISLTDLAADARAATPSQAAEMLVPDAGARRRELLQHEARIRRAVAHRLAAAQAQLDRHRAAIGSPERLLAEPQQVLDESRARMERCMERLLADRGAALGRLERRLAERHPRAVIADARAELGPLSVRLGAAMRQGIAAERRRFAGDVGRLEALSPLRVLARGYAIAKDPAGRAIVDARAVAPGDRIEVRVHQGSLRATVTATAGPDEPLGDPSPSEDSGGGSGGTDGNGEGGAGGGGRARPGRPARRRAPRAVAEQLRLGLDPREEEPRVDG